MDNPFEVLQLDPGVTEAEAVRQAAIMAQRAGNETVRNRIRQAIGHLTASRENWLLWSLLTPPGSGRTSEELDRFVNAFRRGPARTTESDLPKMDREEIRGLLCDALARELELSPGELEPLPAQESAEEIQLQSSEVTWLALLFDMRG